MEQRCSCQKIKLHTLQPRADSPSQGEDALGTQQTLEGPGNDSPGLSACLLHLAVRCGVAVDGSTLLLPFRLSTAASAAAVVPSGAPCLLVPLVHTQLPAAVPAPEGPFGPT